MPQAGAAVVVVALAAEAEAARAASVAVYLPSEGARAAVPDPGRAVVVAVVAAWAVRRDLRLWDRIIPPMAP